MLRELQEMSRSLTEARFEMQEVLHSSQINLHLSKELGMKIDIEKLKREKKEMEQLIVDYGKLLEYMIEAVAGDVKRKEILMYVSKKIGEIH